MATIPPRQRLISPLTRRILAVNVVAPVVLVLGLLYLGRYETELVSTELGVMSSQARLYAVAVSQTSVAFSEDLDRAELSPDQVNRIVRRIASTGGARIRVFGVGGEVVSDSRRVPGADGTIEVEELPPIETENAIRSRINMMLDAMFGSVLAGHEREFYRDDGRVDGNQLSEVTRALGGETASMVRRSSSGRLVLSVAHPIQDYKVVTGALLLTADGDHIAAALRSVRLDIIYLFFGSLLLTVLLSIYLANAIARPIRSLVAATQRVRGRGSPDAVIPDLSDRGDEIGELSIALRDMTQALKSRMTAIEQFAADVAHEIKNPLTSVKSAVETFSRLTDPEQQRRLAQIILDDVDRLNRLITDISDASRLDAELARERVTSIDLRRLIEALMEIERATAEVDESAPRFVLDLSEQPAMVAGLEGRLVQVFRNLIANARSFSPPRGRIGVDVGVREGRVCINVDDEGPGIPSGKEEAIFDRFYSERPEGEKFGTHSGLGLSISRQIIEAHGGTISAVTRRGPDGQALGARFVVELPLVATPADRALPGQNAPRLEDRTTGRRDTSD